MSNKSLLSAAVIVEFPFHDCDPMQGIVMIDVILEYPYLSMSPNTILNLYI